MKCYTQVYVMNSIEAVETYCRAFGAKVTFEIKNDAQTAYEHCELSVKELMEQSDRAYGGTCITLEVDFDKNDTCLIEEYFPDSRIEEQSEEKSRVWIQVPPGELLWKALRLSMGDRVEVISQEACRNELIETAQKFYLITTYRTYSCRRSMV